MSSKAKAAKAEIKRSCTYVCMCIPTILNGHMDYAAFLIHPV
jgi:hypothetical protein